MADSIDLIINQTVVKGFNYFFNSIPKQYHNYFSLGFFLVVIAVYSILVWKFYRFLAKRDILELNLNQYNRSEHSGTRKLIALVFFILEYIIILPILVFFWFFVMALVLLLLAKDLEISNILLISASIVGATRITSYYSEDLSKDLAKIFPLTILVIALTTRGFFSVEGIISKLAHIGELLPNILIYLFVVMFLEFILRMFFILANLVSQKE